MAIEGADSMRCSRPGNMRTDLGHDRGAKGHVGDKVAIHLAGISVSTARLDSTGALEYDVDMKPRGAMIDSV